MRCSPFVSSMSSHLFATTPDGGVHALEGVAVEKLLEDFLLKRLDELQLAAALHLEPLQLLERAVEVEDGVAFLDELPFLFRRGQDHRLVRSVHLELDGHLRRLLVRSLLRVHERLVLVVRALQRGEAVQHRARVRDRELLLPAASFGTRSNSSGNDPGRQHQIPSVSNSSGFPMSSTRRFAI